MFNRPFQKFSLAALVTIIMSVYGTCAILVAAFLTVMKKELEDSTKWGIHVRDVSTTRLTNYVQQLHKRFVLCGPINRLVQV